MQRFETGQSWNTVMIQEPETSAKTALRMPLINLKRALAIAFRNVLIKLLMVKSITQDWALFRPTAPDSLGLQLSFVSLFLYYPSDHPLSQASGLRRLHQDFIAVAICSNPFQSVPICSKSYKADFQG
jgi:hypothetical protein